MQPGEAFWPECFIIGEVYFTLSHIGRPSVTGYFIMSYAKFDPLAKVTIARFPHYKRTVLSSAVRKESMGYFAPCEYPVPLQPRTQWFQAS